MSDRDYATATAWAFAIAHFIHITHSVLISSGISIANHMWHCASERSPNEMFVFMKECAWCAFWWFIFSGSPVYLLTHIKIEIAHTINISFLSVTHTKKVIIIFFVFSALNQRRWWKRNISIDLCPLAIDLWFSNAEEFKSVPTTKP